MYTNIFRSDSIGNNNLDSANKTNLSDTDNHKKKFNPIHTKHPSNTKKLAKSIFSPIHPSTKKIMSSITSSQHNISESSKKKLQENISNIIPIITTPTTNSSAIRKTKQKYTTKIKEKVENLKFKNLTPSRPHVTSSTDCTSVEPYSKHLEYKLPIQQLFTPVTNGTS